MADTIDSSGTRGFFEYVKRNMPWLYPQLQSKFKPANLAGLADDLVTTADNSAMPSSMASTLQTLISSLGTAYLTKTQADAQKQLIDIQLQRAAQNLPPLNINPATYGLSPSVSFGMTPQTQQLVMWGGIGLLTVMLLGSVMKHGRR